MCTSFVVYSDQTFIGMNFDGPPKPIKLVLQGDTQLLILQQENGQFLPGFGINHNGTFMNVLSVDSNEEGKYRRGKNCLHIMKLFEDVLGERIEPSSLGTFLDINTVVNVPNYSMHSMIAGKNRSTYIVEPGRNNIDFESTDRNFMVLTNFPLSENLNKNYTEVAGPGSDRYTKAFEMLSQNTDTFDKQLGFSILKETMQHAGDYPTQFSIICMPEENVVYFALRGDFNKLFEFSFTDKQIRTYTGFTEKTSYSLSKRGMLLTEFESCL
jgi:hypothetical protein